MGRMIPSDMLITAPRLPLASSQPRPAAEDRVASERHRVIGAGGGLAATVSGRGAWRSRHPHRRPGAVQPAVRVTMSDWHHHEGIALRFSLVDLFAVAARSRLDFTHAGDQRDVIL